MAPVISSEIRFVEAEGVRLRAVLDGPMDAPGPPVVVLHGFTGSAESMAGVAASLSAARRVVRLELVGHGESGAPKDLQPYTMSACSEQVLSAIAALELGPVHLLGYSMGGRAALATAVAQPRAFASLVLVGATAGIADSAERAERMIADEALADRIEDQGIEAFVEAWMALPLFASQARLGEAALARARAERLQQRPEGLANSLRGMGTGAQPPLHDRLASIESPVLLVVGEEDAKFRAIAAELERALPNARVAVLADAGHAAHLEAPEAFVAQVSAFFAAVETDEERGR